MSAPTLNEFLESETRRDPLGDAVPATIAALARAGSEVWRLAQDSGAEKFDAVETGTNADGDRQIELDIVADRIFLAAAVRAGVAAYASEERAEPEAIDAKAKLALAVDPLDGSSNVALNLSFGTIFSILPAVAGNGQGPLASFLQPGENQLAAGLIIYGPQLTLVLSLGDGTHIFAHSRSAGDYRLIAAHVRVPPQAKEFAINASNYRHWDDSVRFYFDDCVKGVHGPRERDYNMRWLASLVVEAYRILNRGGVFLYPADKRPGYARGRLRLVYEANPVAFLMEQSGGAATNGVEKILSLVPESLHQRTPLVFGSGREVAKLTSYHTDPSGLAERSPLFGQRGLFRN
jgi:fructose-1,6-bisphosphatase I